MEKEKEKQDLVEELKLENQNLKEYLLVKEQQDNLKNEGLFRYELLMILQNLKHLESLSEILNKLNENSEKETQKEKVVKPSREIEKEEETKEEPEEDDDEDDGSIDKVNYEEDENEDIPYEEEEPVVKVRKTRLNKI